MSFQTSHRLTRNKLVGCLLRKPFPGTLEPDLGELTCRMEYTQPELKVLHKINLMYIVIKWGYAINLKHLVGLVVIYIGYQIFYATLYMIIAVCYQNRNNI